MVKFKNEVLCEWKDSDGTEYLDLVINDDEGCLVVKENDLIYLMNGKQVYSAMDGADYPGRDMTEAEYEEIIAWAKQYFESKGGAEHVERI